MSFIDRDSATGRSTDRPPATASGSPTPTCGSRSPRTTASAATRSVFGGGKVIRESMGQSTAPRAEGAPDLVITGAVILDHWGIVKADVGVRDGRIVGIGKAGNPDTMDGVDPALVIGPSTEIMSGNGKILTAGAIDCHVHLICPQQLDEALGAGHHHDHRRRHRPGRGHEGDHRHAGAWNLERMLEALDHWPINVALLGKGNTVERDGAVGAAARRAPPASSCTRTGARRRRRSTPACGSPTSRACRWRSTPTRSTRPATSRARSPRSPGGRSTRTTPRVPAAATPPTSSPWPRSPTCCRRRPTRPGRTPSTPSTSTSTC